jgi:PEP-CTERM/exosortase A-associated glycosyltransferase
MVRSSGFRPTPGRVLHVIGRSLPADQTGYSVRTQCIARAQRQAGLDPHVVTELGFPGGPKSAAEAVTTMLDGVQYHRLDAGREVPVRLDQRLALTVSHVAHLVERVRPAVLHAASDFHNALVALEVGRSFSIPVVYEVRGFWEDTWLARHHRGAATPERYHLLQGIERACARAADRVVTLADTMRAELVAGGVPEQSIFLVPNAVDVDVFRPAPRDEQLARKLDIQPAETVIGYVSSLERYEGIAFLLHAIASLASHGHHVRGLIVGDGPEREQLVNLRADLGLSERVIFTGRVSRDEVLRYYSLIDVFVVPRTSDRVSRLVTPLKPLEAMATGKAVVVSGVAALIEMISDGKTGCVFRPEDAESLVSVLEPLVADAGRRGQLGAAARRWVVEHRTWQNVGQLYRELYQSMGVPLDREESTHERRSHQ